VEQTERMDKQGIHTKFQLEEHKGRDAFYIWTYLWRQYKEG